VFRRRRREEPEQIAEEVVPQTRASGPWDADEAFPEAERVDLGGMRISIGPDLDVQLAVVGEVPVGVIVLHEESALQLHAFAAPKRSGLWDEVRTKLATGVKDAGGSTEERTGPFGTELIGQVPGDGDALQPVRYLGIDGPRWFLRAVISGRAVLDESVAARLEEVLRDVVIVRGDEPMAPEEAIALRLPSEAKAAGEESAPMNPFKRGPEISEIR